MRAGQTYITLITFLVVLSGGCKSEPSGARLTTDDVGRSVHLPDTVLRAVTLAPSLTEVVFAAGAGDRLVGVGQPDNFPPSIERLPRFSTYPVDFEAIAALDPDLALATDQVNSPRDAETLAALDIPTYFLSFERIEDVLTGILTVGDLMGTQSAARATVDSLRGELSELRDMVRSVERKPEVLFLIGTETLFSFGSESYVHEMIELAGAVSVTGEIDAVAPVLTDEFVLSRRPEVIMGPWGEADVTADLLKHHPTWDVVPAIQNGRVYGMHADLVERPGPRLVAGIRAMAEKLHPNLFAAR
ncbi:MAG: helical backbone metal receptor [Rhodothermales bacterium]